MPLPSLLPRDPPWPSSVSESCQILNDLYESSNNMLESGNHNRHRLQHHVSMLFNDVYPLIIALDMDRGADSVPSLWLLQVAQCFVELTEQLIDTDKETTGEGSSNVQVPVPIAVEHTGQRGRPHKMVDPEILRAAMDPEKGLSKQALAKSLGIDQKTLRKRLRENDVDTGFSNITNADLDVMIKDECCTGSTSG
ncbi:unnamed protein product [Cyclocybe aegerita]|uniref:Uncharacterized protein n=1 Tax=Cyclocybe aegerita TaxID=1973307 RepID=A0A8S0VVA9_CYCAE|nr:unnamed protein product [Cyclocybe aegerita]